MFAKVIGWVVTYAIVRAVAAFGIGVVTYGAVIYALSEVIRYGKESFNALPGGTLQFLGLAGVPECLGILCGAVMARASLTFVKRLAFIS